MGVSVKTMNTNEFYDVVKDCGIIGVVVFIVKRNASKNLLDFSRRNIHRRGNYYSFIHIMLCHCLPFSLSNV